LVSSAGYAVYLAEQTELLRLKARVRLVEPGRIEGSTGESKRVVDRREL